MLGLVDIVSIVSGSLRRSISQINWLGDLKKVVGWGRGIDSVVFLLGWEGEVMRLMRIRTISKKKRLD